MGIVSNIIKWAVVGGAVTTPEAENKVSYHVQQGRGAPTIEEADAIHEFYKSYGIVDGTPGRVDDRNIHRACENILRDFNSGAITQEQAYNRADAMTFLTWNNHSDGVAAHKALEEVSRTISKIQGFE